MHLWRSQSSLEHCWKPHTPRSARKAHLFKDKLQHIRGKLAARSMQVLPCIGPHRNFWHPPQDTGEAFSIPCQHSHWRTQSFGRGSSMSETVARSLWGNGCTDRQQVRSHQQRWPGWFTDLMQLSTSCQHLRTVGMNGGSLRPQEGTNIEGSAKSLVYHFSLFPSC